MHQISWYLHINNKLTNTDHLDNKINDLATKVTKINGIGFSSYSLGKMKRIQTAEANTIKLALNLSYSLANSELLLALGIEKSLYQIDMNKLSLLNRLTNNSYTKK